MKTPKVHSAHFLRRHREPVLLATAHAELVTCLCCLYWMRRYIPLGKLKKHQTYRRKIFFSATRNAHHEIVLAYHPRRRNRPVD